MSWLIDTKNNDKTTKDSDENFDEVISRHRKKIKKERDVTELTKKLVEMQTNLLSLTKRYQLKEKWDLEKNITTLQDLIEKRQNGHNEEEFEALVAPYINELNIISACSTVSSKGVKRAAPTSKHPPLKMAKTSKEKGPSKTYKDDSLRDELLSVLDNHAPPIYVENGDMCETCNIPMMILGSEALLGCPKCSKTRLYIQATSNRCIYGDEIDFVSFSYKRQNHFLEWLSTFQAKETTEVTEDTLTEIMAYLYEKKGINDVSKITQKKVREVLKELKLRRLYDHSPQLLTKITNKLPPRMTPFQEEQVKLMFAAIQSPFSKHCPQDRINFLSYSYCLYKFCELMGYDKFLPCFQLLKGRDKLVKQDMIFRKICAELDWSFVASI